MKTDLDFAPRESTEVCKSLGTDEMKSENEIMKQYEVEYVEDNKVKIIRLEAVNPGQAFMKAKKQRPDGRMIRCVIESRIAGSHFWIDYVAPKEGKPRAAPKYEQIEQTVMPWA